MRRASKVDSNQKEIVAGLRAAGYVVQHLHTVGDGCPDLLVGAHGHNVLLEVKDGNKPPSARKLTQDERDWHSNWSGQISIVNNIEEAVEAVRQTVRDARGPRSNWLSFDAAPDDDIGWGPSDAKSAAGFDPDVY